MLAVPACVGTDNRIACIATLVFNDYIERSGPHVSPDGVLLTFIGIGDVEAIRMKITKRSFYAKGQTTATPLDIANKVCVHDATLPKRRTLRPDFIPDGQPCYMPVDLEALRRIVDPLKDETFIQKTIRLNDTVVMFWSMAEDFAKWNVPRSVTESAEDYHARREAIWQTVCDDSIALPAFARSSVAFSLLAQETRMLGLLIVILMRAPVASRVSSTSGGTCTSIQNSSCASCLRPAFSST